MKIAATCLALMLAAPLPALAQSGRAEITLPHTGAAAVRPQLVNAMLNHGYSVAGESQSLITFEKPADNVAAMFLFGTRMNMVPMSRVSFSLVELSGSTRVVADIAIVANAGSAYERRNDLNYGADRDAAQTLLNQLSPSADASAEPRGGNRSFIVKDGKLVENPDFHR